jgi:RNA-directed DNA polymerase
MNKLKSLKKVSKKSELASLLGVKASFLTHTLYVVKPSSQYTNFKIPKKNGGERSISAPTEKLKTLQSCLSKLLLDCIDEINKIKYPDLASYEVTSNKILKVKIPNSEIKQPSLAHGFVRNRSIITNAMMHVNQKNILNIDLNNFFDSFNFGRVRAFFIKNKNFKLPEEIATVFAQIACNNNMLPQGSPCSPVISNLITHSLDIKLAYLAHEYSCRYSRYADDITFSTRKKAFPTKIMSYENNCYVAGKKLQGAIKQAGFSINDKKTRIQYKDSRQDVTGLIVNKKPNVKNEYWRGVRAQCNRLFTTGQFTKKLKGEIVAGNINELEGQLNFIDQVDHYNRVRQSPPLDPKYHLKRDELLKTNKAKERQYLFTGRERTFSQFLYYRSFYANNKPTILCEGKTDNIYLKAAISERVKRHPTLASQKKGSVPYELLVNFFNYSPRTRFLLELSGGTDYLKDFITNFNKHFNSFKAPKPKHPVIIVLDNDKGPNGLLHYLSSVKDASIIPSTLKLKTDYRKAEYIHVFHNLYVVLTPLSNKSKSQNIEDRFTDIESLFKKADLLRTYQNKCFNIASKRTEDIDLSKNAFANQIVKGKKTQVNFSGFNKLLNRIEEVIKHYDNIIL